MTKNKILNILSILIILILAISIIPKVEASDFKFNSKIILNHEYDEDKDEVITCTITYDKDTDEESIKEREFDKDGEDYDKTFEETIEIKCDEDVDEIEIEIYNKDDKKITTEKYSNTRKVEFVLEDEIHKGYNYFQIEMTDFYKEKGIDCKLEIDGDKKKEYDSDDDSDNDDLKIKKNFDNDFEIDCDESIDEVIIKIYDDEDKEITDKEYTNIKNYKFDIDENKDLNELRIEIDHNFNDDNLNCDLKIDNDDTEDFKFDDDSSSSALKIVRDFEKEFTFDCGEEVDEMDLRIYNSKGDKIYSNTYKDDEKIDYTLNNGKYVYGFSIRDSFEKEVKCEILSDTSDKEKVTLNKRSEMRDLYIEDGFDKKASLSCNYKLDNIHFYVFELKDFEKDKIVFEKTYIDTNSINFDIDTYNKVEETEKETDDVQEEGVYKIEDEKKTTPKKEEVTTSNLNKTNDNFNKIDVNKTNISVNSTLNNTEEKTEIENKSTYFTYLGVFIFLLIAILFVVFHQFKINKKKKESKKNKKKFSFDVSDLQKKHLRK